MDAGRERPDVERRRQCPCAANPDGVAVVADYALSLARDQRGVRTGYGVRNFDGTQFGANHQFGFSTPPTVIEDTHVLGVHLGIPVKTITLLVGYAFEAYDLDDWQQGSDQPWVESVGAPTLLRDTSRSFQWGNRLFNLGTYLAPKSRAHRDGQFQIPLLMFHRRGPSLDGVDRAAAAAGLSAIKATCNGRGRWGRPTPYNSSMSSPSHWQAVYQTKNIQQVSWYTPAPRHLPSLIRKSGVDARELIADVGGGARTLGEDLRREGFERVIVLDLAHAALAVSPVSGRPDPDPGALAHRSGRAGRPWRPRPRTLARPGRLPIFSTTRPTAGRARG